MIAKLVQILRNEEGIETLEWIAIAVLIIVGIAAVVYGPSGGLNNAVSSAVGSVSNTLTTLP